MSQLSFTKLSPNDRPVERWLLVLHGIMGTKANWQSMARKIVDAVDGWGAVLVDLREHGDSKGFAPPHTVLAAASDLLALDAELDAPIEGVLGHSFGGKTAIAYAGLQPHAKKVIVVDASPSQRLGMNAPDSVTAVIDTLVDLPKEFENRNAFVHAVVAAGHSQATAAWLAMNLRRRADGSREFNLDLNVMRALLADYAQTDFWNAIEAPHSGQLFMFIVGDRSDVVSGADLARLRPLEATGEVRVVHADAGHWVHVDAPELVLQSAIGFLADR
ncbi:MAG: alpha/beta hydrolase [Polyangiales bacterium]